MKVRYSVMEMFYTLQGEGYWSGRPAVFIRFAGCNAWSGDPAKRHLGRGVCAEWCDTEFRISEAKAENGGNLFFSPDILAASARGYWSIPPKGRPMVVLTGGEPSLQVDERLVTALKDEGFYVAMETNGSHPAPHNLDWLTLSPKPPLPVLPQDYDEVKVVYPVEGLNPDLYKDYGRYRWIQPLDGSEADVPGTNYALMEKAVEYVLANPLWRLSLQTHKIAGVE